MTAPNLSYSLEHWQIQPNDHDVPNVAHDAHGYETEQLLARGFPFVLQGESGPWALENYDWSGEMALKSSDFIQNWQLSNEPDTNEGGKNWNMTRSVFA